MKLAIDDSDINDCYAVMQELRPNLNKASFLRDIRVMQDEGFQLSYIRDQDGAVATVAGFRIALNLAAEGKALYVYDLSTTAKKRSQGFGTQMINALKALSKQEGCKTLHLDSGVQRHAAHRFYLVNGFDIKAHHFSLIVSNI